MTMRSKQWYTKTSKIAEQLGEQVHGNHCTRLEDTSGVDRQADGGWQELSSRRRSALHSAPGSRTRRALCHHRSACSCSRPKPAMRGCSTRPIISPHGWPVMEIPSPSTSKKPIPPSRSAGRATIALTVPFVYVDRDTGRTRPSSDIQRINCGTSVDLKISNMFG